MTPQRYTAEQVGLLLDAYRAHHQIRSEIALAQHLGVTPMTIRRWRRGDIGIAAAILLQVQAEVTFEADANLTTVATIDSAWKRVRALLVTSHD